MSEYDKFCLLKKKAIGIFIGLILILFLIIISIFFFNKQNNLMKDAMNYEVKTMYVKEMNFKKPSFLKKYIYTLKFTNNSSISFFNNRKIKNLNQKSKVYLFESNKNSKIVLINETFYKVSKQ
jgi:hypothetical protein